MARPPREDLLRRLGFSDIFKQVKDNENDQALAHLVPLLQELDAMSETARSDEQRMG